MFLLINKSNSCIFVRALLGRTEKETLVCFARPPPASCPQFAGFSVRNPASLLLFNAIRCHKIELSHSPAQHQLPAGANAGEDAPATPGWAGSQPWVGNVKGTRREQKSNHRKKEEPGLNCSA